MGGGKMGNATIYPGNLFAVLFVRMCSVLYYQRLYPFLEGLVYDGNIIL
jgi:hypothetical protein